MQFLRKATFVLIVAVGCTVAGLLVFIAAFGVSGRALTGTTGGTGWLLTLLIVGPATGLVLGTCAALRLVGRVPIGRFVAETAGGVALGVFVGLAFVGAGEWRFFGVVIGPLLTGAGGFAVAVAHLAWRYRATPKSRPGLAD